MSLVQARQVLLAFEFYSNNVNNLHFTAALDGKSGREIVEIMQRLAKEQGTTILMVTHDNRILDVADRIVHLEDGYLAQNDLLTVSE